MADAPDSKSTEKTSPKYHWFSTFTALILLLGLSWILGINMGWNALIDAENIIQRNVTYKNFEVHSRGTAKHGRTQTLTIYFEDGTPIKSDIDVLWLTHKLSSLEEGTELSLTLDASEKYLLGIQHGTETLMHETASIHQLNIKAWLSIIIGAVGFVVVLAIIIHDIKNERVLHKKQISQ